MGWFKWVGSDEVVVSVLAVEDAIRDGVLKKLNQQVLSEETGIQIDHYVGQRKTKK